MFILSKLYIQLFLIQFSTFHFQFSIYKTARLTTASIKKFYLTEGYCFTFLSRDTLLVYIYVALALSIFFRKWISSFNSHRSLFWKNIRVELCFNIFNVKRVLLWIITNTNLFTHSPIHLFTFEINVPSPIFKTHKKKVYYVKKGWRY